MIIIGITGSIGMGKTTISSMLKFLNIPVFDSDKEVKRILEKNQLVIDKIQKIWPDVVYLETERKKINKFFLANKIFNDKKNKKEFNLLMNIISQRLQDWMFLYYTKQKQMKYVILYFQ